MSDNKVFCEKYNHNMTKTRSFTLDPSLTNQQNATNGVLLACHLSAMEIWQECQVEIESLKAQNLRFAKWIIETDAHDQLPIYKEAMEVLSGQ